MTRGDVAGGVWRWASVLCVACLRGPVLAAAAGGEVKTNWQDVWRGSLDDCEKSKRPMFLDPSGGLVSRRLKDIPALLAKEMTNNNRPKQPKPKPKPRKSKMSKKERMKQELLGHIGGDFDAMAQDAKIDRIEDDPMFETYEQQAQQSIGQIANNAKLKPDDELTLREFCDLIWRAANWSPLDQDEKKKEDNSFGVFDDDDDFEEEKPKAEL